MAQRKRSKNTLRLHHNKWVVTISISFHFTLFQFISSSIMLTNDKIKKNKNKYYILSFNGSSAQITFYLSPSFWYFFAFINLTKNRSKEGKKINREQTAKSIVLARKRENGKKNLFLGIFIFLFYARDWIIAAKYINNNYFSFMKWLKVLFVFLIRFYLIIQSFWLYRF